MEFQLKFSCVNAAFWTEIEDGNYELSYNEIGRVLRRTAFSVEERKTEGIIRDINGNTIGSWALLYEED